MSGANILDMVASLGSLPDEVIQSILNYLPPTTTVALQRTCKRFTNVTNERLLWKYYCKSFRYWNRQRQQHPRFLPPDFQHWKRIFADRYTTSHRTRTALDHVVGQETGRLNWINHILAIGYEAKDTLLDLYSNAASSPNYLAQR